MALTATSRGTGNNGTGATSVSVTGRSATLAAGSLGVLCIALDNAGSGGATAAAPTSATDSKGNVWTRQQTMIYDNGAASAGIEGAIYTAPITVALLTSDTLTLTWIAGVTVVAKAWTWYEIIPAANSEAVYLTGGSIAGATAANAQVTTASVAIGDAVVAAYFAEGVSAVTGDADATNGSWTAQQTDTVGATTSGVRIASQQKVQTTAASTQSYDATVASQDRIAGYIVVHAQHTASPSLTLTGGGVVVPTLTTARPKVVTDTGGGVLTKTSTAAHNASHVLTGGGVLTTTRTSARSTSVVDTGGGVLTTTQTSARSRAAVDTGGGVAVVAQASARSSSRVSTGGGVATLSSVAARSGSVVATGAGILTVDYSRSAASENHDASITVAGGGVATVSPIAGRSSSQIATGGGVSTVVDVPGRTTAPALTSGGVAIVSETSSRASSQTATGGGVASIQAEAARRLAALLSGGGVLTVSELTARLTSVSATGGGVASIAGEAASAGQAIVHATGGGVATVVETSARVASVVAVGGGASVVVVQIGRDGSVVATGGGVASIAAQPSRSGEVVATGGGRVVVVGRSSVLVPLSHIETPILLEIATTTASVVVDDASILTVVTMDDLVQIGVSE